MISTDRLISSSEARKKFGALLNEIDGDEKKYFVITDNGKVTALLVHPDFVAAKVGEDFPNLEKLREEWSRYTKDIGDALTKLEKIDKKDLPPLFR